MLLTADLHLTSNPADAYRWQVFNQLAELLRTDHTLFILGDLADRKDRHPGELVNRLINTLVGLTAHGARITILMGNHDRQLYDGHPPYWHFLNKLDHISFLAKPYVHTTNDLLLLPYTDAPESEWKSIDFSLYRAAFAHIPLRQWSSKVRQLLPEHLQLFSGDEHTPSRIDHLTYVGAPHPINYGDRYRCRLLQLDETYHIVQDIPLHPKAKHMIDITDAKQLDELHPAKGDAAKVRLSLPLEQIALWDVQQNQVAAWARQRGVELASIEPIVQLPAQVDMVADFGRPADVLQQFAHAHNLDADLLATGMALLDKLESGQHDGS